jgi:hypothetical protein
VLGMPCPAVNALCYTSDDAAASGAVAQHGTVIAHGIKEFTGGTVKEYIPTVSGAFAPLVSIAPGCAASDCRIKLLQFMRSLRNLGDAKSAALPPIVTLWLSSELPSGERLVDRLFFAVEAGLEESLNEHDYVHLVYIAALAADIRHGVWSEMLLLAFVIRCTQNSLPNTHEFLDDALKRESDPETVRNALRLSGKKALFLALVPKASGLTQWYIVDYAGPDCTDGVQ